MKKEEGIMQQLPKKGPGCTDSGTSLLDLGEDLLGVIYSELPVFEIYSGRTALRQCCKTLDRCESITSGVHNLELYGDLGTLDQCLQMLAAFPSQADLYNLAILMIQAKHLSAAAMFQAMLDSEAACARLSTVKSLRLEDAKLDRTGLCLLPRLLPRLQEAWMSHCEVHGSCLRTILPLELRTFTLDACDFLGASVSEVVEQVSAFKRLESLCIDLDGDKLPIFKLSELKLLRSLRLDHCTPKGLDVVLQKIPLHTLSLQYVRLPAGFQLISNTLKFLEMFPLSLPLCKTLTSSRLPVLQLLRVGGLDLSNADAVDMKDLLSGLARFPLEVGNTFYLFGQNDWSDAQSLSVLQNLPSALPANVSSAVRRLHLFDWKIGPGFMRGISEIFCDVEDLVLYREDGCAYNDPPGILDAVSLVKNLRYLNLSLCRTPMPNCLEALLAAKKDCRYFHLSLKVDETLQLAAAALSQQWQGLSADQADSEVCFDYDICSDDELLGYDDSLNTEES